MTLISDAIKHDPHVALIISKDKVGVTVKNIASVPFLSVFTINLLYKGDIDLLFFSLSRTTL
jgi:hypothetical protein